MGEVSGPSKTTLLSAALAEAEAGLARSSAADRGDFGVAGTVAYLIEEGVDGLRCCAEAEPWARRLAGVSVAAEAKPRVFRTVPSLHWLHDTTETALARKVKASERRRYGAPQGL